MNTRSVLSFLLLLIVCHLGAPLNAQASVQGVWTASFNHVPNGASVDPASDSIANPSRWITQNFWPNAGNNNGFQAIHTCLIPSGPHRGELLVWDGNLTQVGVRVFQPWSIVNPYWPAANPYTGAVGFRFHNATLLMPGTHPPGMLQNVSTGAGELFCGGQCWLANGLLFVAGGTRVFPPNLATPGLPVHNNGNADTFEGAKLVYQWDERPNGGQPTGTDPFGKWWPMPDLDAERWYPTVATDGTTADRVLILAGSDAAGTNQPTVNTYESYVASIIAGVPQCVFEAKQGGTSPRQYLGPKLGTLDLFTEYPRFHALGVLDQISTGTAPRLFVSGYFTPGIRWAHDSTVDPGYLFDVGQMGPPPFDPKVIFPTCLLYPSAIGAIGTKVLRIGGNRTSLNPPATPTDLVESVVAGTSPSFWSSGQPSDFPKMTSPRYFHNVVILPTGDLFAVGGVSDSQFLNYNLTPELLINGRQWFPMAPHTSPRDYHSCAVLLPDGRVLVCSGENRTVDYEIWSPPYFHLPSGSPRPLDISVVDLSTNAPISDTAVPGVTWGQQCQASWSNELDDGIGISRVVLMKPAALTHHDDGGQRCIQLLAWHTEDGTVNTINFQLPATVRHAPAGWWMLFLLTNEGVPGNAFWVNLG